MHYKSSRFKFCLLTISVMTTLNCPNNIAFANPKAWALSDKAEAEFNNPETKELAVKHIDQALLIEPNNAFFWQNKAAFLQGLEESEKALPCITKSLQLDSKPDYRYALKAEILNSLNRFDDALSAIDYAIKFKPGADYFRIRVKILTKQGKLDLAEKELDKLIASDGNNRKTYALVAMVARKLKHWPKEIEALSYLLDTAPVKKTSYYEDLLSRSKAYTETKQYDKAIADCKAGLKGLPEARQFHSALLKLYELSGKSSEAKRARKELESIDDDLQPLKSDRF